MTGRARMWTTVFACQYTHQRDECRHTLEVVGTSREDCDLQAESVGWTVTPTIAVCDLCRERFAAALLNERNT